MGPANLFIYVNLLSFVSNLGLGLAGEVATAIVVSISIFFSNAIYLNLIKRLLKRFGTVGVPL